MVGVQLSSIPSSTPPSPALGRQAPRRSTGRNMDSRMGTTSQASGGQQLRSAGQGVSRAPSANSNTAFPRRPSSASLATLKEHCHCERPLRASHSLRIHTNSAWELESASGVGQHAAGQAPIAVLQTACTVSATCSSRRGVISLLFDASFCAHFSRRTPPSYAAWQIRYSP